MPPARWKSIVALSPLALGCAGKLPDPREAVEAYAAAAAQADADALYEMLSEESRRGLDRDDIRRLVEENEAELAEHAKEMRAETSTIRATARVRYGDGEEASLALEDGAFKITQADALPPSAPSPEQALRQFRKALARRSYPGLLRTLSAKTRQAIEEDLRALVESLDHPEQLDIVTEGDRASVRTESGHHIRLRRERSGWLIEAFER